LHDVQHLRRHRLYASFVFGWDVAVVANVAVAVGTLALAAVTWRLALQTRDAVREAKKQAEISVKALEVANRHAEIAQAEMEVTSRQADLLSQSVLAAVQPMLVSVPQDDRLREPVRIEGEPTTDGFVGLVTFSKVQNRWVGSVPLRNIGPGVAAIASVAIQSGIDSLTGIIESSVLATGEQTRFQFSLPDDQRDCWSVRDGLDQGSGLTLMVGYRDVAGQIFRTAASLHRSPSQGWLVRQIALYRGDDPVPFASSGPSGP
jgi:hypothetical protein